MRQKKTKHRDKCSLCGRSFFSTVPAGRYKPVICGNCIVKHIEARHEEKKGTKIMKELINTPKKHPEFKYESTCYFCKKVVKTSFPGPSAMSPVRFICNECLYNPDRRKLVFESLSEDDAEVIS